MFWFAFASLTPAALLLLACLFGGSWAWVALGSVTLFVMLADRLAHVVLPVRRDQASERFAKRLGVALAMVHFVVLPSGVYALATSPDLTAFQTLGLGMALGLYMGQVSNSNAHELIHAANRHLRRLGTMVYISLLFGHHASAHPKVHHIFVATPLDPNSAPKGRGFYAFWPRCWMGSFRSGLRAENTARARLPTRPPPLSHPYVAYVGGAFAALALAYSLAGPAGVVAYLMLATYTQMQLILADYVQHYGLRRPPRPDGRWEPAGAGHSWNARQWYSSAMMLNAPRHSDHHMHPLRPFPALRLDRESMPILPFSLPTMAAIAMVPPLWRRIMDPRVARWQSPTGGASGDDLSLLTHATDSRDPDGPGSADPVSGDPARTGPIGPDRRGV